MSDFTESEKNKIIKDVKTINENTENLMGAGALALFIVVALLIVVIVKVYKNNDAAVTTSSTA